MGNIETYILTEGNKTLTEMAFNDVDNVVLSYLAYYDFRNIVPSSEHGGRITVAEAAVRYAKIKETAQKDVTPSILKAAGESKRFGNAWLSDYADVFLEGSCQFAAIRVTFETGTEYLAFRGVEETELTAWTEAFRICYMITPAQRLAAAWVSRLLRPESESVLPGSTKNPEIFIGGHSKGGNLALYAACECEPSAQNNITRVYINDGPGLTPFLYGSANYMRLEGKIRRIVPGYSIVGCLFWHGAPDRIVNSSGKGIGQHNCDRWEVSGQEFEDLPRMDSKSRKLALVLNRWITSTSFEERQSFTEDLFSALRQKQNPGLSDPGALFSFLLRSYFNAARPSRKAVKKFFGAAYVTKVHALLKRRRRRKF